MREKSPRCITTVGRDSIKGSAEWRPKDWLLRLEFGFLLIIQLAILVGAMPFIAS